MTQFSIHWILSLNHLSHFWGQVQDRQDYHLAEICKICLKGKAGESLVQEICRKLEESISKHQTHFLYHDDLLVALFSVQPVAALNGIFADTDLEQSVGVLSNLRYAKRNPLDVVPEDDLLAWCDQAPQIRYPAIASAITIARNTDEAGLRQWTTIALRLLDKAPDRVGVLKQFIEQFSPMSWSGSRASIVEANAKLLDELIMYPDPAVTGFVAQEKVRLSTAIEQERHHETERDKKSDERFE